MSQRIRSILELQKRHNVQAHSDVGVAPTFSTFRHFAEHIGKYASDLNDYLLQYGNELEKDVLKKRAVDTMLIAASLCCLKRVVPEENSQNLDFLTQTRGEERASQLVSIYNQSSPVSRFVQGVNFALGALMKICDDIEHMDEKEMENHHLLSTPALKFLFLNTLNFFDGCDWDVVSEMAARYSEIQTKQIP